MNIMEKQTQKRKILILPEDDSWIKFKKQMKKSGNIKDDTDSDEEDVEDPKKPPPINKSSQQVPPPIPNRDHDEEGNNANENDNLVQETVTDAPKLV